MSERQLEAAAALDLRVVIEAALAELDRLVAENLWLLAYGRAESLLRGRQ